MAQAQQRLEFTAVKKYTETYTGNASNGDIFIVQRDQKIHKAGVYSDGQIIQLKITTGIFYNSTEVTKTNVDGFTERNRFAVYRKRGGISQAFKENITEALSRSPENDFSKYNCMEFVMELLDINLEPSESDCWKIGYGGKPKGFKVVKRYSDDYCGNALLGDLFIVPSWRGYHHAGVSCSVTGQEIIQYTSSGSSSRFVNKVNVSTFSRGRRFAIYRRKKGIPDSFQNTVEEALSKTPRCQDSGYNCIRFALELLYGKLKENERDVESLAEMLFAGL